MVGATDRSDLVEQVLDLVEAIPPGRVTTYGLLADVVGFGGPRWVGRVLSTSGAAVPWWRVVRADGSLPASHRRYAVAHYREEGTPVRTDAAGAVLRVDVAAACWLPPH